MIDLMLDQAEALVEQNPRSSAAKRRAISSAYYASFHMLMWVCAREVLPEEDVGSDAFGRVYRSIDHGPVKNAFLAKGSLEQIDSLQQIRTDFIQLQDARMLADYAPPRPNLFARATAKEHIARARSLVSRLKNLNDKDRQTLAIHLLFQARKK